VNTNAATANQSPASISWERITMPTRKRTENTAIAANTMPTPRAYCLRGPVRRSTQAPTVKIAETTRNAGTRRVSPSF